jgi:hypothetical protein
MTGSSNSRLSESSRHLHVDPLDAIGEGSQTLEDPHTPIFKRQSTIINVPKE